MMISVSDLCDQRGRLYSAIMATVALYGEDAVAVDLTDDYRDTVAKLMQALGPNSRCEVVDPMAWDVYKAAYRARHGISPAPASIAAVLAFLAADEHVIQ